MTDRIAQLVTVQNEARELFEKKNQDYGDAFAAYGPVGVLVRIGDKIQRLQSITSNNIATVSDEKMRDTLIDLHNYAAMAIMLIDEHSSPKSPCGARIVVAEAGVGSVTISDIAKAGKKD